jgi:limonene-1,2-epoxide hydrolase
MIDKNVLVFANDSFYHAFAGRDLAAMDQLWARDSDVTCIHPGWAALRGRDQVMAGWRSIMENPASPDISPYHARPHVLGEDGAFVVCYEKVPGGVLIATNIFVEEDGRLCLVHHQAAPCQDPPPEQRQGFRNIQ